MRKLYIIQTLILATLTAATIYMYKTDIQLYQAQQHTMTPKPEAQVTPIDEEKQQLRQKLCLLQSENEILKQENEQLNWYWKTFFSPAQRAYMRRGK